MSRSGGNSLPMLGAAPGVRLALIPWDGRGHSTHGHAQVLLVPKKAARRQPPSALIPTNPVSPSRSLLLRPSLPHDLSRLPRHCVEGLPRILLLVSPAGLFRESPLICKYYFSKCCVPVLHEHEMMKKTGCGEASKNAVAGLLSQGRHSDEGLSLGRHNSFMPKFPKRKS